MDYGREQFPACFHGRGKIISYQPYLELCYECGKVIEGDPHSGHRNALEVPGVLVEALMKGRVAP